MRIRNEEFTVRHINPIETRNGLMAQVFLSQPCPRRQSRKLDYRLTINGGKAKIVSAHMPVGSVVLIEDGMLTNESYNRGDRDNPDWQDQVGILLTGGLKILHKGSGEQDDDANAVTAGGDHLPF